MTTSISPRWGNTVLCGCLLPTNVIKCINTQTHIKFTGDVQSTASKTSNCSPFLLHPVCCPQPWQTRKLPSAPLSGSVWPRPASAPWSAGLPYSLTACLLCALTLPLRTTPGSTQQTYLTKQNKGKMGAFQQPAFRNGLDFAFPPTSNICNSSFPPKCTHQVRTSEQQRISGINNLNDDITTEKTWKQFCLKYYTRGTHSSLETGMGWKVFTSSQSLSTAVSRTPDSSRMGWELTSVPLPAFKGNT